MSNKRSQDELLNQYLDELTKDINAPAPIDLEREMVDFARRLAISEQTPPSHTLQNQIWDQLIASQPVARPKPSGQYIPSSNGHYPHPIELPIRRSDETIGTGQQSRWTKPAVRVAGVILFLLFGASLVYLIQLTEDDPTQTTPINAAVNQTTPTPKSTRSFNPEIDGLSLPPNQDQAETFEIGSTITNSIAPAAYYIYTFNAEAGNIYTVDGVSDQQVMIHYRTLNRPAIGGSGLPSSGGGGGSGGGGSSQDVYYISGSISVSQDAVVWLSIENTSTELAVTYTLSLEQVEFPHINYGDIVSAPFVPSVGEINWQFDGQRGDVIRISVESDVDTSLHLQNPDGTIFFADDDSGSGLNPEIYRLQLPSDGVYRISVRPHGGYDDSTNVQLSLMQYDALQFVDDSAYVELSSKQSTEVITFEGTAGEQVQLEAIPLDTISSLTSIDVVQNGETIATMDLLPNSYPSSSGTEGTSGGGSAESLSSESETFVIPSDGIVKIFVNTSSINIQNNEDIQYGFSTHTILLNLIRLD